MKWYEKLAVLVCVSLILGVTHGVAWQIGHSRGSLDALLYCGRSGSNP